MGVRDIPITHYDYPLPERRIASFPLSERDSSRLLIYNKGDVREDVFASLPLHLPAGTLVVFNDTRVIQARLRFRKDTGAAVEVFLLEPASPREYAESFATRGHCAWHCLVGNLKRWKEGTLACPMTIGGKEATLTATRGEAHGTAHCVDFRWTADCTWVEVLEAVGELPIPPYLNRKTQESDKRTYQTVYGRVEGSVAAPTAGLHFTDTVLASFDSHGIDRAEVTLHVGAGTFRPVKSDTIGGHEMHAEHIAVPRRTVEKLIQHHGRAMAVGTTSVRTLESLYYMGIKAGALMDSGKDTGDGYELRTAQWEPYALEEAHTPLPPTEEAIGTLLSYMDRHGLDTLHSSTRIIIAPGYTYRIVSAMLTNFHQPQSTLLLLVSAFVGEDWRKIYDYALATGFRFLSYGDSSLLMP